MANKRASLLARELVAHHVDLGTDQVPVEPVQASVDPLGLTAAFPSLTGARQREVMVPFTVRLPKSMMDRLDALETSRGVRPADLVRDFIAFGLKGVETYKD